MQSLIGHSREGANRFPHKIASVSQTIDNKHPATTHLSATPKLFFTLLLSKIACQAPKPAQKPVTQSI